MQYQQKHQHEQPQDQVTMWQVQCHETVITQELRGTSKFEYHDLRFSQHSYMIKQRKHRWLQNYVAIRKFWPRILITNTFLKPWNNKNSLLTYASQALSNKNPWHVNSNIMLRYQHKQSNNYVITCGNNKDFVLIHASNIVSNINPWHETPNILHGYQQDRGQNHVAIRNY